MTTQNFTALFINLDRDTERCEHMQAQLKASNITAIRQPGILGDALPADIRHYFYQADGTPRTTMKRGEIGCYASHLRALMRVASGTLGPLVLIMEDDLAIAPDAVALIEEALEKLPKGWDILRLSSPPRKAYAPLSSIGSCHLLIRYSKIPTSAGAYLVTQKGARKFLTHGVRGLTFDDDLRRPWFHEMDTYGIAPPPMRAGQLKSSIDAIEAGRFDKPMSSRMERIQRGDYAHTLKRTSYNMRTLGFGNWLACNAINIADMLLKHVTGSIIDDAAKLFPAARKKA